MGIAGGLFSAFGDLTADVNLACFDSLARPPGKFES